MEVVGLCASGFLAPPWGPVTLTELKAAAKENIPPNRSPRAGTGGGDSEREGRVKGSFPSCLLINSRKSIFQQVASGGQTLVPSGQWFLLPQ